MVCLGKGQLSVLDPMDKVPQDENKTKSSHSDHSFLCDSCQGLCLEMDPSPHYLLSLLFHFCFKKAIDSQ